MFQKSIGFSKIKIEIKLRIKITNFFILQLQKMSNEQSFSNAKAKGKLINEETRNSRNRNAAKEVLLSCYHTHMLETCAS